MAEERSDPTFVPYDIETEQGLLGLSLIHPHLIPVIRAEASAADFYEEVHQQLFELVYEFDDEQRAVTPITLNAWAKHLPGFKEVGGHTYLMSCAQAAPAIERANSEHRMVRNMARHVAEMRVRREAESALLDAHEKLKRGDPTAESLIEVSKLSDDMQGRLQAGRHVSSASDAGFELTEQIEKQAVSEIAYGCTTGLRALDDLLGALLPGDLIIVAGRPGMGKSVLGTHFSKVAAQSGWSADYWSLEMPARQLAARFMADLDYDRSIEEQRKALLYSNLVKLRADQADLQHAAEAAVALKDLDITIFDAETVTIEHIGGVSRARAAATKKRKLFVVDHLGLIEPDHRYVGRKVDELGQITKRAKQIAKRTESPVVLLCQLSRKVEERPDRRPILSDLRDSGAIEQDADVVLTLYRGAYYAEMDVRQAKSSDARDKALAEQAATVDKLEIGVEKNRAGVAGKSAHVFIDIKHSAVRDEKPMPRDIRGQLAF